MKDKRGFLAAGLIVVALIAFPAFKPPAFLESFLYLVFFWIALTSSWQILSGYTGYFSFGHGAFFGIGMYTTANLATKGEMDFLLTLPIAGIIAAVVGVLIGAVVFRVKQLRGELFALLTLAVTFVLATIALNTSIDGGPGVFLSGIKIANIYGSPATSLYLFALLTAVASLALAWWVQHSRFGGGLFAIADDEDVAEVLGVPTYRFKLIALGLSSFIAGVGGGIQAVYVSYVTVPETFSITVPLFVVLMSLIGGSRHWLGAAIGAAFITTLNYVFVGGEWALAGRALIGLILIVAILYLPDGLMGLLESRRRKRQSRARAQDTEHVAAGIDRATEHRPAAPAPKPAGASQVLLRCEDVQLSFRGVRALAGISLEVRKGEILGIVGPNGSGKSTLINTISGFYRPDAGRILFRDRDLAKEEAHKIAALGVGRTYQIPRPFVRLSVLENVALPAMYGPFGLQRAAAEAQARTALEHVGLAGRADALPTELNLHQRKFLEIARALASGSELVLLDEVLAGLTPTEIASAVSMVRSIRDRGATIIFIEHNMRAVLALTERLIVLDHGEVIAEGEPRDVMRRPAVITAYLGKAHA
ncbi:MAG: branched-chain amino acid ABC transporter ATP-binding protein/permease [Betaproteobacteria bacterium]|nr:branched-chain amino acid ABC transporter ATP-binding protein/permease [Betaproteobacteria bacterium]